MSEADYFQFMLLTYEMAFWELRLEINNTEMLVKKKINKDYWSKSMKRKSNVCWDKIKDKQISF